MKYSTSATPQLSSTELCSSMQHDRIRHLLPAITMRLPFAFLTLLLLGLSASSQRMNCSAQDNTLDGDQPMPAEEAAATMRVPEGFQVQLFAGEPDVQQPIAFCIDDRGRLWVAEAYNYPNHTDQPGDRIVILEDTDGDGQHDQRTVFYDQLNYVTGIEVGFGGVWVMSPPYFYFIPDEDGDDQPDDQPQVLLDGFGTHANAHNLANGFAWGPDGWLYGTHGRTNWSMIGRPGDEDTSRVRFDGGVYRYHPIRHEWEPYADGTTNPWGIDWNEFGDAFICNCVNPHLFHVIPGAHYEPWRNRESSKYAYQRIPTIADHLHFVGVGNIRDGIGSDAEDQAGGGHAHCGLMIYLGDNWPESYRNSVFTNNIHGRRINNDILRREGSGYVASHGNDILRSQDDWFMGVTLTYGFDGCVYVSDWSDTGECHSVRNTRRGTGRIYRISYGQPEFESVDISKMSLEELVECHLHKNERFVRHARRNLQERMASSESLVDVHRELDQLYQSTNNTAQRLRFLWTLHATNGLTPSFLLEQLGDPDEYIRAWSLRLLCEPRRLSQASHDRLVELATHDPSSLVRLHLASNLQRLPYSDRWDIAEALIRHGEDNLDDNLPLFIWYGIEPLVSEDLERFARIALHSHLSIVSNHVVRRIADGEHFEAGLAYLFGQIEQLESDQYLSVLEGIMRGLEGRRSLTPPETWSRAFVHFGASNDQQVRRAANRLATLYRDQNALAEMRRTALDSSEPLELRIEAIDALVIARDPGIDDQLIEFLAEPNLQQTAVRGLAEFDHDATESQLVESYAGFAQTTKQQALSTLASRVDWANALLDAVENNLIPPQDITAFTARQIESLNDRQLRDRLYEAWGQVRSTSEQRQGEIAQLVQRLNALASETPDLERGHALFAQHCANCHQFFGEGENVGPDLSGAQRTNITYLLENIIDPSAAVSRDFRMDVVMTESGRVITGLIVSENAQSLAIQTVTDRIVLPIAEIEDRSKSNVSLMPNGLLQQFSDKDVFDLLGYMANPTHEHDDDDE